MQGEHRRPTLGAYGTIVAGCILAGIAIGAFIAGPTGNRQDHYFLAGIFLGLGVGLAIVGVMRALSPHARPVHPAFVWGGFAVALVAILALAPPVQRSCLAAFEQVVQLPGGASSQGDASIICRTRASPGGVILLIAWAVSLPAWIVVRRVRAAQRAGTPAA